MSEPSQTGHDAHKIIVPREIANDDSVSMVAWSIEDGVMVEEGTELCIVETSKAAVTLVAERRGYLRQLSSVGDDVGVGGVLGYLSEFPDSPLPTSKPDVEKEPAAISAKALRKIKECGLNPELFADQGLVRERDVIEFITQNQVKGATEPSPLKVGVRRQHLSVIQRRVVSLMEQSTTIPVAYVSSVIDFSNMRERASTLSRDSKMLITPVDLLVAAVARSLVKHPLFNARFTPPDFVELFQEINVGVAVDVDDDLYVVVVKNADSESIQDIAVDLRRMQMLALRRRLAQEDVTGGTVTVTSMLGRGVHRFQPILHPGETAIIALAEQGFDSAQAELTVGFDHRVANGSQVATFMSSICDALVGASV